jgi:hypothetical protein
LRKNVEDVVIKNADKTEKTKKLVSQHDAIRFMILDMTKEQLIELNGCIVERLRMLHQESAKQAMTQYSHGDTVSFNSNEGVVVGTLTKMNKKSVTVYEKNGKRWNVSPNLLTLVHRFSPSEAPIKKNKPYRFVSSNGSFIIEIID